MKYILAVDFGTSAVKSAIFDERGALCGSKTCEYPLIYGEQGKVELELNIIEEAFRESLREVILLSGVDAKDIISLGFSSAAETLLFLDKECKPVRNGITWMDKRAQEEVDFLNTYFGKNIIHRITGQANLSIFYPAPKLLWLKKHEPNEYKSVWKFMFMKDYIIYRLTGQCVCDDSVLCTSILWDINTREYWKDMLDVLDITEEKLPEIRRQGSMVGRILPEAAREYGLSEEIEINIGAQDQLCGALGVGNINSGILSESSGSAMVAMSMVDHLIIDPKGVISCMPSAIPGKYMVETYSTGAIAMRWFRDIFGKAEMEVESYSGLNAYDIIDREVERIPAGSEGLMMLPFLQGTGAPDVNYNAKGVFFGITLAHRKEHFSRAIMEGVALSLNRMVEGMEELGLSVTEIISLGGGAKSKIWSQIKADVTNLPIRVTDNSETSACFGAAILAGVEAGIWESTNEAVNFITFNNRYDPDPKNREIYKMMFSKFKQLRRSVDDIF